MAKIIFISTMDGCSWGGSEFLWSECAKQALQDGHDIYVSICDRSIDTPVIQQIASAGAKIIARTGYQRQPSIILRALRKLATFFRKNIGVSAYQKIFDIRPDVICISQCSACDIGYFSDLASLAIDSNIPYISICQHNTDLDLADTNRQIIKDYFHHAQKVLFVSQSNLNLARRQIADCLPNAELIQNPVNLMTLEAIEPFPDTSTIEFASVARLNVFNKGQDILFEALSAQQWKNRNWQCNLYGSGEDLTYLQNLACSYKIEDKIKFQGHVKDVRKIWAKNHILVLPSRAEGTPLALIESMLCARPSIVTDIGGNTEWIVEGENGFIADATTTASFQSALERAWQNRHKWEEMGHMAHDSAMIRLDTNPGKTLLQYLTSILPSSAHI